jgi:hypothetical protein
VFTKRNTSLASLCQNPPKGGHVLHESVRDANPPKGGHVLHESVRDANPFQWTISVSPKKGHADPCKDYAIKRIVLTMIFEQVGRLLEHHCVKQSAPRRQLCRGRTWLRCHAARGEVLRMPCSTTKEARHNGGYDVSHEMAIRTHCAPSTYSTLLLFNPSI